MKEVKGEAETFFLRFLGKGKGRDWWFFSKEDSSIFIDEEQGIQEKNEGIILWGEYISGS